MPLTVLKPRHPKDTPRVRPLWRAAVEGGVDVALTGHEHSYERHVPMAAVGAPDENGARLLIAGTGGGNRYRRPPLATTEVRNGDTWGVVWLTLRRDGYESQFLPVAGRTFTDAGSGRCR